MPVYENLWSIVENTPLYSTNSRIAQYLLLNYEDIDQHHLDEIAYGANVVKSTVSKFFKELSEEGTYASFLAAVNMDKKYARVQKKKDVESLESKKYVNEDNLNPLVESIQSSSHIIVFTKSQYLNEVREFCHHLLKYSIIAKSSLYCYKSTLKQELLSQKENDCILFIETDGSFYEYALKLEAEMDFSNIIKLPACKKYVISNQTQKFSDLESIEFYQSKKNDNQQFLNSVFSSIYHKMNQNY